LTIGHSVAAYAPAVKQFVKLVALDLKTSAMENESGTLGLRATQEKGTT